MIDNGLCNDLKFISQDIMNKGRTVFAQIMDYVPWRTFQTIVDRYHGDDRVQTFKTSVYFRIMAFAQLSERRSMRTTINCLNAMKSKLFHMGISSLSLTNVSNAGRRRNWKIFADLGALLIDEAKKIYVDDPNPIDLDAALYALDSTAIDLSLSLFPWAEFRSTKAAIKVHTLLNLRGNIPELIRISTGKTHDVMILDQMSFAPGGYYVMDRAYTDFKRLHRIEQSKAFFVTRAKKNVKLCRVVSRPVDKTTGLRCDQSVVFKMPKSRKAYPHKFRRIKYFDEEHKRPFVFLTNNFSLPAMKIAELYKKRWQVELFFKWIKQNLQIKRFFGHNENAVRSQLWIAIDVYLIVAILRKELEIDRSMTEIQQIFNLVQFENIPIKTLFGKISPTQNSIDLNKSPFLPRF